MHRSIVVLLAVRLVDESTGFLAPASVEDFRADLNVGYAGAAAMFVAYGVGGVIGNLAVVAGDGRSRKPVTVGGAAILVVALLIIAAAGDGWMMLLGAGLVALGATGLVHGGEIAITNALTAAGHDRRLESVLAKANLGAVAGDLAAPLALAGLRAAGVGWRPVFTGAAVLVATYTVALAAVPFPDPVGVVSSHPGGTGGDDNRPGLATLPIRRQRLVWYLALGAFVAMPLDESYLSTVLAYAEAGIGWSGAQAAALGAAFVIGGVLAFTVLPRVVAGTTLPRLMTVTGIGLTLAMMVAAGAPAWALPLAGIVHSTLLSTLWLGEQAAVLRANPGREGATKLVVELLEGTALGLVFAIGLVADRFGLNTAMWVYAAVPLLLPVIAWRLHRDRRAGLVHVRR
jgi:predicted MFS family arabinose efflux permease